MFQECLRRLRNCAPSISWEDKAKILSDYMNSLRWSGYSHEYRARLLEGVLKRQEKIDKLTREGSWKKYRSRQEILEMQAKKLGKHPNTWFLNGEVVNTFKVPATPHSRLAKGVQAALHQVQDMADKGRTKVLEMGGYPITMGLAKNDNFGGKGSCHMGPVPCNTDQEQDCRASRAVYRAECMRCLEEDKEKPGVYIGTNGRTLHSRTLEHMKCATNRHSNNPQGRYQ